MVASSSAAKAAKTNNRKQTGSTAKTTDFKKKAKEPPTPAQRRAKQEVDKRYRANKKMEFEDLKADNLEMKEKLSKMRVELQSMDTKLKERNSENTLLRTALRILGEQNTSLNEMVTEFVSVIDGQGSGFPTASTAGSIFVENPKLAAAIAPYSLSTSDHVTDYDLAAGHDLPVKFYAPNNHDIFSNLSTHPAAGFSTSSAAGPSCVANHGLPNNPDNNPFSHDPATGFPTAAVVGSSAAYPESAFAFAAPYYRSTSDLFPDHDLAAAAGSSFAADPELASVFDALDSYDISDLSNDHDLAAAGSSFIAGHDLPVMVDVPNNHDTISNLVTHDPDADYESGSPIAFVAGSSVANHDLHAPKCYDIYGLFTHEPAAN